MKSLALILDRSSFMAWVDGVLLDRNAEGECVVGDNQKHERAEELMLDGQTIGLTENGKLVSVMFLDQEADGFVEEEVNHG